MRQAAPRRRQRRPTKGAAHAVVKVEHGRDAVEAKAVKAVLLQVKPASVTRACESRTGTDGSASISTPRPGPTSGWTGETEAPPNYCS